MKFLSKVFILGHPGSGKALIAKKIAEILGYSFIDADLGFEHKLGATIQQVFGEQGTRNFLHTYHDILKKLYENSFVVINTDACCILDESNRKLLSNELTVYLKTTTGDQLEKTSLKQPPLINQDASDFFDTLHKDRDKLYEDATVVIDTCVGNFSDHISGILAHLQAKGIDTQKGDQNIQAQDRVLFNTNNQRIELSEQQAKCLKLLAQGLSAKEIALRCNLSYRTVEKHLANIMELTHTESSKQLLSLYYYLTGGIR